MRRALVLILIILLLVQPVSALELTAPDAPEDAEGLMPVQTESFAEGLWEIIKDAIKLLEPELAKAGTLCISLVATVLLVALLQGLSDGINRTLELGAALAIGALLLHSTRSMIQLGTETVNELSDYGKLLLPVMTAALAAQGGATSSAALYGGTVVFNTVLTSAISRLLIPAVYIYLVLCIAACAVGEESLKKLGDFVKWLMTCLFGLFEHNRCDQRHSGCCGSQSGENDHFRHGSGGWRNSGRCFRDGDRQCRCSKERDRCVWFVGSCRNLDHTLLADRPAISYAQGYRITMCFLWCEAML